MKTHFTDLRLKVNAGINFPLCMASWDLLPSVRVPTVNDKAAVTCKHCQKRLAKLAKAGL